LTDSDAVKTKARRPAKEAHAGSGNECRRDLKLLHEVFPQGFIPDVD
jgi:hypothetical protein